MKKFFFLLVLTLLSRFAAAQLNQQNNCAKPAPATMEFHDIGPNSVTVSWSPVLGANHYRVELLTYPVNTLTNAQYVTGTQAVFNNLQPNQTYEVRISTSGCPQSNPYDPTKYGNPTADQFRTAPIVISDMIVGYDPIQSGSSLGVTSFYACIPWVPGSCAVFNPDRALHVSFQYANETFREIEIRAEQNGDVRTLHVSEYDKQPNDRYRIVMGGSAYQVLMQYYTGTSQTPDNDQNNWSSKVIITAPTISYFPNNFVRVQFQNATNYPAVVDEVSSSVPILVNKDEQCDQAALTEPICSRSNAEPQAAVGIAPNPFSDRIAVRLQLEKEGPLELLLVNTLGQIVRSRHFNRVEAHQELDLALETSDLAPGIYLLVVQTNAGRQTTTLYKQ